MSQGSPEIATTGCKNRTRVHLRSQGFTLIELMLVVGIAAILALLATPNLMTMMRNMAVSGEGRTLYGAFVETRSKASSTGNRHRLEFDRDGVENDPETWSWRITSDEDDDDVFEKVVQEHQINNLVRFGPADGFPNPFPVPYHAIPRDSWCTECGDSNARTGHIEFDIDGTVVGANSGSVSVEDASSDDGRIYAIAFIGPTGDVRLFAR